MSIQKVLLIDDEEDIREIGEFALQAVGGFCVTLAASGAEGVHRAAEALPDVILLDVMMPGLDGQDTFRQLRSQESTSHIPVVFLTARVQRADIERLLALGATGVIAKPFDPVTLAAEIRTLFSAEGTPRSGV